MNKIIAALDGLKLSRSCIQYAIEMTNQSRGHLVGAFLDDFTYHSYKIHQLVGPEGVSEETLQVLEDEDVSTREKSVGIFEELCEQAAISYAVHRDRNIATRELLHESIFGDLLVIDKNETLSHYDEPIPTRFVRDLLTHVQSPVLLVPDKYKPVDKVILLYNGDPASVYAIKMFNYILPSFFSLPTEVLSIKAEKESLHLPDKKIMKEFMKSHYPKAAYTLLKGDPEAEIVEYLRHIKQNVLVVLGAYQRGMVSRWFKPSMADILMKELNFPLFIAHNK
jgi:nucleotide-binding universal stress UspA family protein